MGADRPSSTTPINATLPHMHPIDHIGIAVPDLEASIEHYRRTFGYSVHLRERVESQGVDLAFLHLPGTKLELMAPIGSSGPIFKFLEKRGPGLHHIGYYVTNIRGELKRLKELGVRLIDEEPRLGADRTLIAFIHPSSMGGVLSELVEPQK